MSENNNLDYLLEKFTGNTCSREELYQLLKLVEQDPENEELTAELRRHWEKDAPAAPIDNWEGKLTAVLQEAREEASVIPLHTRRRMRVMAWSAAACAVLILIGGSWWYYSKRTPAIAVANPPVIPVPTAGVIAPGKNKALLTLANGATIDLDSSENGTLAQQGNVKIIKGEDGELLYYPDKQHAAAAGYNTISTPRGGKYAIVLADGTKVWLNAASSLKFPAAFTGKSRNVFLTGEAYFEVAASPSMPFNVNVNDMMVEVLGTHFNINAYSDESSIATTLFTGAVRVKRSGAASPGQQDLLLQPGEQADLESNGKLKVNDHADISGVIAWRDNYFEFNNTALPVIMRQIARWYDVGIEFKGPSSSRRMTGKFSRNVNLDQLIGMLSYAGVKMKIDNKKILIWEN
jgi:transmembrane sensor